jgi:hypothetical protein
VRIGIRVRVRFRFGARVHLVEKGFIVVALYEPHALEHTCQSRIRADEHR